MIANFDIHSFIHYVGISTIAARFPRACPLTALMALVWGGRQQCHDGVRWDPYMGIGMAAATLISSVGVPDTNNLLSTATVIVLPYGLLRALKRHTPPPAIKYKHILSLEILLASFQLCCGAAISGHPFMIPLLIWAGKTENRGVIIDATILYLGAMLVASALVPFSINFTTLSAPPCSFLYAGTAALSFWCFKKQISDLVKRENAEDYNYLARWAAN